MQSHFIAKTSSGGRLHMVLEDSSIKATETPNPKNTPLHCSLPRILACPCSNGCHY